MADMTDPPSVADLTLQVLVDIRGELREIKHAVGILTERVDHLTERVDHLTERVDHLTERVDRIEARLDTLTQYTVNGFGMVDRRFDTLIRMMGEHHAGLESRVTRIEQHLKLG